MEKSREKAAIEGFAKVMGKVKQREPEPKPAGEKPKNVKAWLNEFWDENKRLPNGNL